MCSPSQVIGDVYTEVLEAAHQNGDKIEYRDDLTSNSLVYREHSPVQQRTASLLSLLDYFQTDPVFSGVSGLISELKPEQHNLHL